MDPKSAEAHNALGDALVRMGKLDAAIALYRQALALSPDMAEALTKLSRALSKQGRLEEAEAACRRALAIAPDYPDAHFRLAKILLKHNRITEAFESFTRCAELSHQPAAGDASGDEPIIEHKSLHDQEQRDYLATIGIDGDASGRLFHLATADGRELPQSALSLANGTAEICEQWRRSAPQIVVLDDFLTDEALDNLRRFCWGSTIWETAYKRGYLEASLSSGISCPLLAQVADELRRRYPAVFASHPLSLFWGFKYDSRLAGVGVHSDIADINVNFWITPDEANLDPATGGIIIWDTPPPPDWAPAKFNSGDPSAAADFVESVGARSVTIPYRSNRAVIFDSSLFHATDNIRFNDGYLNRRINLTLLYGRREVATDA
jgi:hypothetical protein